MYCSKCGARCPEDANYCHRCGYKLYVEPAEEAPTPLPEPEPAPLPEIVPEPVLEEPITIVELPAEAEPLAEEPIPELPEIEPEQPNLRGRRSLRIALLVMVIFIVVGTACWALLPDPPVDAPAAEQTAGYFSITENGELSFYADRYTGGAELTIPETVEGITVLTLADDCFASCTDLISIELPKTLTTVGSRAFYGCTALRGLQLPDGVGVVGENAFSGCTALEALTFPGSITKIAPNAMDNCPKLMFIFYDGTGVEWAALYHSYITPYTQIICTDGAIRQLTP